MSSKRLLIVLIITFMLSSCATAVRQTDITMSSYDKDTMYGVKEKDDGFVIAIEYSRYQFYPESDAVAIACKSQLTSIAWEYAERKGRKIEPLNDQRIRISMGRNGFSGITSCQATGIVKFIK